ncbi:ABC transporter permease [Blastococcus saxobsidens]|uniref:ABC-type nitrate/sulfonate/bicarbonate transport system permease component n=1 Tax=Blastococcus saxobsidens TaxID=138336 RepID=A0A4Q7Y2R0_9ACTN|nr:ABC transporter permease [Blastococcus saxobsidens]RZU31100.1 ABC-type nitrate/sulfonate/bicarbonate transport system permease component [Blastococcus saxobsidens]
MTRSSREVDPAQSSGRGAARSATADDGPPGAAVGQATADAAAPGPADTRRAGANQGRRRPSDWLLPLTGVAVAILIFELAPRTGFVDQRFLPPASEMFTALWARVADGSLWQPIGQTLQGWSLGLGTAMLIALPLGILIGSVFLLFMSTRTIVEFLRPIPSVALIPLTALVFGAGLEGKWFLAAFAATWPILLQTLYGVRDVDPVAMETARSFGIRTPERLWRVVLPSALPYVVTGIRISSAVALILAVTVELVLGAPGLGQEINIARQSGAVASMYALIIVTGLIGWVLNIALSAVERRLLHWHASQRERNR